MSSQYLAYEKVRKGVTENVTRKVVFHADVAYNKLERVKPPKKLHKIVYWFQPC